MTYKDAILHALKTRGITQRALATKLGITPAHMNDYINRRKKSIRLEKMQLLLDTMDYELVIRDKTNGDELCTLDLINEEFDE